jgi:hypothetical protein
MRIAQCQSITIVSGIERLRYHDQRSLAAGHCRDFHLITDD